MNTQDKIKSRSDRLWEVYKIYLAFGTHTQAECIEAAESTVQVFDKHVAVV